MAKQKKAHKPLRILLVSNSGWSPSGYGTQILSLAPRLREAGHDIAVSAFYGLQGGQIEWKGIKHYPAGFKPYGNDVIHLHARDFKADIVITLIDVWVLRPDLSKMVRWLPWSPIDHSPVPPTVLERLKNAWGVMAYSEFAMEELRRANVAAYYVPHGLEPDIFKPMPEKKERLRAEYGVPKDAFVVGMVAANQSSTFPTRKGFERILPAIANLRRKGLDKLYLYMHTYPGTEMGGIPLIETIKAYGVDNVVFLPRPEVFPMGGLSREELADLYNLFDVYICPSMAEGFGLPLIEAQACGIPVIATEFSACKELCSSGWYIEPVTMVMTPAFSFQALPSISSIADRILHAYNNPDELREKSRVAVEFAKRYDWDKVVGEYWLPMLDDFAERIEIEDRFKTGGFSVLSADDASKAISAEVEQTEIRK